MSRAFYGGTANAVTKDTLAYNVKDYGAAGDGTTDDSTAVQDTVTAALAADGGTVWFPAGRYRLRPGALSLSRTVGAMASQAPLKLAGPATDWRTTLGSNNPPEGGAVLDFQGSTLGQGVGCIETFGAGMMEVTGLLFWQSGTAHTIPYIFSVATTLLVNRCGFRGHSSKSLQTCDQDAIVLGGMPATEILESHEEAIFQGYGTVIAESYFNKIRRAVWGRRAANGVVVRDNTVWNNAGAGSSAAAVQFDGHSASFTTGATIIGNLIESNGYTYSVRLGEYTANCSVIANNFYDPGDDTDAYVKCDAQSSVYHTIIAGYHNDTVPFVEDSNGSSTVLNFHQSQVTSYQQPVTFANTDPGAVFSGMAKFTGGLQKVLIQPAADQTESAQLLLVRRSAADNLNPSGNVMEVLQDGSIRLYTSSATSTLFGPGGRNWVAEGTGGQMTVNTGTGGSQLNLRAFNARLMHYSSNAELCSMRIAPQSATVGAFQTHSGGPLWTAGSGSPESVVVAPVGSLYSRTDGGAATSFYVKESGSGNTGWVAK